MQKKKDPPNNPTPLPNTPHPNKLYLLSLDQFQSYLQSQNSVWLGWYFLCLRE